MKFTEENIAALFGHEAAEDEDIDRLKAYYFKGKVYSQVANELPIRILVGHKGIGKSALFHVAMAEQTAAGKLTILIKPDDIAGIGENETDFLKLIREWKSGITEIISKKALISFGLLQDNWRGKLNSYGGQIIDFLQSTFRAEDYISLAPAKAAVIKDFLRTGKIYIYLDDLDRGWQGTKTDIRKISALLNAIRDIASEVKGVAFRVSLRSDVYYLVRTSDESTDKIEGSVVWFSWSNHEILALLAKRVDQYFGMSTSTETLTNLSQPILAGHLNQVIEPFFNGKGKWENIPTYRMMMSLIRKRPRDLVKLCTLAAKHASSNDHELIGTKDFNSIFEEYSQGRLQDTINEYRSELPDIERLLFGMKPSRAEKRSGSGYIYTTTTLLEKIKNIQQNFTFHFYGSKVAETKDLAAFLYKINFLTARKEKGQFIERRYFEESRYLSHKFVDFGFDWEMHPAYRWALQPDNLTDIFLNLSPSED
ncbi:P-loop ATPase, Sll1717 family [Pseudomonas sp. NCHU5208]|uniref:P-loop ATPase, Sll1717 family n=1 Tax=unclassified Pseudomonas TaxID=196821 RepID=UPI003F943B45